MIEAGVILALSLCATFAIFIWKLPKKIRRWVAKRQLTLDIAFTVFCMAVILPFSSGPTTLIGIAIASVLWTTFLWTLKEAEKHGSNLEAWGQDLRGLLPEKIALPA